MRIRIRSDPVFLHGSGSGFQIFLNPDPNPDPVFKFLWIRIRFVLRGWIRIRIRIRNPADADYGAGVTNLKPYVNPKITRFQDEREIFYLEIPSFLVLSILFLIEGFFVNFTKYVININGMMEPEIWIF